MWPSWQQVHIWRLGCDKAEPLPVLHQVMMRLKGVKHLDPRQAGQLEAAYYATKVRPALFISQTTFSVKAGPHSGSPCTSAGTQGRDAGR